MIEIYILRSSLLRKIVPGVGQLKSVILNQSKPFLVSKRNHLSQLDTLLGRVYRKGIFTLAIAGFPFLLKSQSTVAPSQNVTFDGLQLLQESDTVSEQIESDRFFMPVGKYTFSTRDSAGLPTLPTRKGTVGATNNFERNSSRANRFTAWVRFPGQGVGDSVEVRVRKDNPNGFPVDALWWAISNSGNPSDWVDPQSVDQLPQLYRVPDSIYATSPQPQGLLGPPTTPNWPIGDQSYHKNNRWMRQGYSSNGGLVENWVATIAVAPCGNYFAFGKYDPWVFDDKYFLQYRAPGGNWQDVAPGDFNSFNPASPSGGCTDDIPDLKLTAAASLEDGGNCQAEQNDEIVYTFTVENTGTVDATKVNISQSSFNGSNSLPVPSLVGGATQTTVPASGSVTFTSRYPLSPNDINVGVLNLQVEANAAEITLPTLSDAKTNRVGDLISAPYTKDSDGDGLANNDPTVLGIREINLVKNGSFENSANNFPSTNRGYNQLNAPNNTLDNWLITTGSVDQIYKSYWPPSDGDVSIDMSGVSASKLEQDVSGFIVGNTYRLEFSINRHRTYFRRARKVELGVSIANLDTSVVIEGTGTNWIRFSTTFKATSPTETLEFNQADFPLPFDAAGMALDDVSIYAPAATESSTNLTHKLSASIEDGGDCSIDVGDKVIYTFTVENVGGADATNVFIKDTVGFTGTGTTPAINFISGTGAAAPNFIPQGEKAVFQSEYVLTQADLDSGLIQNQALVYADQLCDPVISDTETRPNGSSITSSLNMDSDGDNINANDATVLTIRDINLVNNGSFENSANNFPSGGAGFNQLNAPDSTLDSWYLSTGTLDQIDKSFWIPQKGDISIDMAGISAGKLEQRVYGFLPGRTYRVDFYYTRHRVYFRRPQEVELGVRIANLDTSVTYSGSGTNWVKASLEFVATDTAETIEFNQIDYPLPFTAAGMTIDGVTVYAPSAASPSTELTFIKSASIDDGGDCSFDVGDEVTYTFTVENIGGEDATNVNLVDSLGFLGGSSFPAINFVSGTGGATADIIPAGEKSIYQSTYALTQTDLDSGIIINQARVYADQLCGYELSDTDVRPNGSSISDPLNTDTDGDGVLDNDQNVLLLPQRAQSQAGIFVWPADDGTSTPYKTGAAQQTDIDGTGVDMQVTYRSPQNLDFKNTTDFFNVDNLPAGVNNKNGLYWKPKTPGPNFADFVFNKPVQKVRFRINDLDEDPGFGDAIQVFAFADQIDGTAIATKLTPGSSSGPIIVENNAHPAEATARASNGAVGYDSPDGSVLVEIEGPVTAFSVNLFTHNGTEARRVNITEVAFETAPYPNLAFLKSAVLKDGGDGSVDPGDSITYTFIVENFGGADATNVSLLDDNKFSGTGAFPSIKFISGTGGATADTIPIGAKATYEADYVLTQADSDKGLVENQALLYADELCEPLVSDADNGALDKPLGTDSDGDGIADNDKTLTTFLCPTSDASDKSSYVSWSNLTSGIADGKLANSSKTVSCQEATITDAKNNLEKISTGKVQFAEGVVGDFAVEFKFPLYDIEVFVDNLEYSNFIGNFRVILQNGGVLSVGKDWYFDVNYPAPLPYVWQYYSTTGEPARRANNDPALITSSGSKSNDQAGFVIRFNSSIESQIRAAGGAKRIEFETGGSSNKLSAFLGIAGSESSCGGCAPAVDGDNDTLSVLAATGGSINVTANDSVSGQSVQVGTNASVNPFGSWPNGITLSASGFADVAPGTTPGNYSLDYLLCDNASPANCDTVAVEVIVAPEIEGVNDTLAVPATGGDAAVTPNDSVNGEPAQVGTNATVDTLGFWPNGVTLDNSGEVLVAPGTVPGTYPLNYLLCDTFSPPNCDTVDVELTVDPVIDGENDTIVVPSNGGDSLIAPNDSVNGEPALVGTNATVDTVGTWPTGVTLDSKGAVVVAPGTPPATYPLNYLLCDTLSPPNCEEVAVELIVAPVIDGENDTIVAPSTGGGGVIAPNDSVNGEPAQVGTNATVDTVGTWPNGVTLNNDGEVVVAPGTVPGNYPLSYLLCDTLSPPNCDTVLVDVTIDPVIYGDKDTVVSSSTGGSGPIAPNDSVNGEPAQVGINATVDNVGNWPSGISLDSNGILEVAPGTPPGNYPLQYVLCDTLTPPNCDIVDVDVVVTPEVEGENDTLITPASGGSLSLTQNDTVNGQAGQAGGNASLTTVGNWPNGISLDSNGNLVVAPGTPPGNYPLSYLLCDTLTPPNCDVVQVDVTVLPDINGENDTVTEPATGASAPVTPNDSVNGEPAQPGDNASVDPIGNWPKGLTLDSTGTVQVAPGTTPGSYPLRYLLCDTMTPENCDTVEVDVTVVPVIDGEDDGFVIPASGGGANVDPNDSVNGQPARAGRNATVDPLGTWPAGITLDSTGAVNVAPGTPPGNYPLEYLLCDTLTPANCDTVNVDIDVIPDIDGKNDSAVVPATGGDVGILPNDSVNGIPAQIGVNATVNTVGNWPNGISLNSAGEVVVAPGTTPGTYPLDYLLCDTLSPPNCDLVEVTVTVTPVIDGENDTLLVPATGDSLAITPNDSVNGIPAQVGSNATTDPLGSWPSGITLDSTGQVVVAPGTTPGNYPLSYLLCDTLRPANCDTVEIDLTVTPVIDGVNDTLNVPSTGDSSLITPNDTVNGLPAQTGSNATTNPLGTWPNGITLDSTGAVVVAPGTPPGSYPVSYLLCDTLTPANCDTVDVEVNITPVIDGENDTLLVPATGGNASITPNDSVNGEPAQVGSNATVDTLGSWPNGVTLDSTGAVVVAPGTPPGSYPVSYLLCDTLTPANCDTVDVEVNIAPVIDGMRDTLVLPSTGGSAAITPNDSVNGQPAQVGSNATVDTLGTWPSGISLDSTGAVVVAYGTPAGSYPLSYLLCDTMLPPNCDTVEIVVNVATYPPNARPDSALMSQDDTITVSPWANDTDPDGNLNGSSVGIVSGPSNGTASVDSLGNVTYIPDSAWTGVDTITYVVCDSGLVPVQCDTSLIVITVYGLPTITLDGVSQVQCFGDSTGSATVSVGGGLAPYRITWSTTPVQTGPVASQLSAGAYTVTVEDSLGGLTSLTVNITQNDSLEVSYQSQAVSCPGASDASIALSIEGGVPPYQAAWSRGDTGQFLDSITGGSYQVQVTDSVGCKANLGIDIEETPVIEVVNGGITDVFCKSDSNGAIYPEISGGTAPYQYRWSNGDTTTFLDGLVGGSYQLLIIDANGCEEEFVFQIDWEHEGCTQGVVIPQGVSDNADGVNDNFFIEGLERFDNVELTIFNRWGTIVYKTQDYQNDWNGQVNRGEVLNRAEDLLPTGVYFYKLRLKKGNKLLSGYIYLDR